MPAAQELIRTAEESGARSSLTHHKAMHKENWGKSSVTLRLLREAREHGADVICDQYPWLMSQTSNLSNYFFPVAPGRGRKKDLSYVLDCVRDDATWAGMKQERLRLEGKDRDYVASLEQRLGPHGILVPRVREFGTTAVVLHSPQHAELVGQSLHDAARALSVQDCWEAARRMYLDDEGRTLLAGGYMSEDDLVAILKWEHTAVSTDAWMLSGNPAMSLPVSTPHPRFYGTFPRVLQRYVRELGVLSLEEAVRKMTGLPAEFLGLEDRGLIRLGYAADIVVFDPASVRNNGTYVNPCQQPDRISSVIVNGTVTVDHGRHTGGLAGRVLRKA